MFVATHNGPQFVCGQAPPGDGPMGQRGTYAIKHDRLEMASLALPVLRIAAAGSDVSVASDVPDGFSSSLTSDPQRTQAIVDELHKKILRITEQIRVEQQACDNNVTEYLSLVKLADRAQKARLKTVFEKKNQKSHERIASSQRKLEGYYRRLREADQSAVIRPNVLRDVTHGLRGVSANVRAGISGFGGGVVDRARGLSQGPRELAATIRNKFGSADNITALKEQSCDALPVESARLLGGSASLVIGYGASDDDECSSGGTSGEGSGICLVSGVSRSEGGIGPRSDSARRRLENIQQELCMLREMNARLEETMQSLHSDGQRDISFLTAAVQEEKFRCERLEEQLSDLTELHQNEVANLKQELASMEEKVAYQSYERARDIQEVLEASQTRLAKLELQQQQQQVVHLEGLESFGARALLAKLINVAVALAAVVLLCVSGTAGFIAPAVRSPVRAGFSMVLFLGLAVLWKHWDAILLAIEEWWDSGNG
uniref:transmembrane and coiled-coil domains protein 2-like isoform X2 n=1 Tax=Myxine glutinosa TaxID=7769 RepID=UPI00358EC0DB